ncbi:MAG: DUF4335 domain-containing protein [Cyanobacteria bacterium J06621_11]
MTIRRQYQLPNCSLILDGLSIDPSPGSENILSLLVNAECRISGLERSLNGGYNFFAALVRAVSQYGQEVLSGFAHPQVIEGEPLLVHINPGDGPYHHLVVQPEIADIGDGGDGRAIDIKLSAVQLFDLTEAVDQFFADQQTLPELEPALSPLARRFVRNDEPLSDRAVPAVLGVGGLVAATMALGLLPVPELRDPTVETSERIEAIEVAEETDLDEPVSTEPSASDDDDGTEIAAVPLDEDVEDVAAAEETSAAEAVDTDATEIDESDADASDAGAESEPDASTAAAGDNSADAAEDTRSAEDAEATDREQEFATYDDFKPTDADSSDGGTSTATNTTADVGATRFDDAPPAAVNGFADVRLLNSQLKQTIVENREQPRFGEAIGYRVRVSEDGTIMGYQPVDEPASSAIDETPLPKLVGEASEDAPAVDYRVVFTERGVVEVSPWWGWNYYE